MSKIIHVFIQSINIFRYFIIIQLLLNEISFKKNNKLTIKNIKNV